MKILKYAGMAIAAVIVLLLIGSLFLPSQVHVERSATIGADPDHVFELVNNLRSWEAWSPWHQIDPDMVLHYDGKEAGEGAAYRWESQHRNVGNGSLTIVESVPAERIVTAMDFMEQGLATSTYLFRRDPTGTQVIWSMDADMGMNPVGKYFGLMMDRMLGPDFEKGLANLKQLAESSDSGS